MSPESQRIAIAEACGWAHVKLVTIGSNDSNRTFMGNSPDGKWYAQIPDYLNDLNAIHAAVVDRDEDFKNRFEWSLNGIAIEQDKYLVAMTAKDWAEAFLKTLGLWRDDASNLNQVESNTADTKTK